MFVCSDINVLLHTGPSRSAAPPRSAIERACSMKEELLGAIERLGRRLPPNTLDQLVDELGGTENVAEVPTVTLVSFYYGQV